MSVGCVKCHTETTAVIVLGTLHEGFNPFGIMFFHSMIIFVFCATKIGVGVTVRKKLVKSVGIVD